MKNLIISLALLTLLSSLCFASTPVALTLKTKGEIELLRGGDQTAISDGAPLINQDKLISGDESFAMIKFVDDGANMKLFANSILTINADKVDDKLNKSMFLQVGNAFSKVNKGKGEYKIETPTTVASVKGTEGFVFVDENGNTTVITLQGVFDLLNKLTGSSISVSAGMTGTSSSDGSTDVHKTEGIDPEWLEGLEGDSNGDVLRINLMNDDGQTKVIEVELE
ncbi:MAG: FecR domain-containing protein [Candidatus Cloacimonadia bacterium]